MNKKELAAGLMALVLAVGSLIGVTEGDIVSIVSSDINVAECPTPECNESAKCPDVDLAPVYDSNFSGRIVYVDRSPYKRGVVRAVGENWLSYALTDDDGSFTLSVRGESPFTLSAYSPFGERKFVDYNRSIMVPRDTNGSEPYCTDGNSTLQICGPGFSGEIVKSMWRVGSVQPGASVEIDDGRIVVKNGGKYSFAKAKYNFEPGKTYHFKVKVRTVPENQKWCVAIVGDKGHFSTKQGESEFSITAKNGGDTIGLFGYGDYTVIYDSLRVEND